MSSEKNADKADWLIENLANFADKTAIVQGKAQAPKEFSYQELSAQINLYKQQLDEQFADGQIIVILSDYHFHAIALFFALYLKNSIIVPIVNQSATEIAQRLEVIQPNFILSFVDSTQPDLVVRANQSNFQHEMLSSLQNSAQPGLVLFSSGSTGEPKAMVHNLAKMFASYQDRKPKNLNMLVFLMFDHIGGLNSLLNSLAMGAKVVLPTNRNPEQIAELIAAQQIQILPASPTFLNLMLMAKVHEKHDLSSLRMITYGTEAMPASLLQKIKQAFPKTKLLQTFGTSETGIAQTSSRNSGSLEIKIDDPNTEYKIVAGELWLKSETQVLGYLNASMESFSADGWFQTGDLVEETADGFLKIIGRAKEQINVGGEKVLPAEIESIILELDFVKDCTAYGQKNAITGQMVAIDVVIDTETDLGKQLADDKKQARKLIKDHCKKLETYKQPAKINFVAATQHSERFKKQRQTSE